MEPEQFILQLNTMALRTLYILQFLPLLAWSYMIPNQYFQRDGFQMEVLTPPRSDALEVVFVAPYHGSSRPSQRNGSLNNFQDNERMQVVLQHPNNEYVDVQVGPFGHHQLSLYSNNRRIRYSLPTNLQTWNEGPTWKAKLLIPLKYLPAEPLGISAVNMYRDGPVLRTWSMNEIPEYDGDIDVHHPALFTPVNVQPTQRTPRSRLWNYARKGILAYEIEDDDEDDETDDFDDDDFLVTFQGFQKGMEANLSAPLTRNGRPVRAAHMVFKNEDGEVMEIEMLPSGTSNLRTYVGPRQELPNNVHPNDIDYVTNNNGNKWDASVLLPPGCFPTKSDEVNIFVDYDDESGAPRNPKYWTRSPKSGNLDDDKFSPENYRKFEKDLLLLENDSPSPFWEKLLEKQPKPTPILRQSADILPTSAERDDEISKEVFIVEAPQNIAPGPSHRESPSNHLPTQHQRSQPANPYDRTEQYSPADIEQPDEHQLPKRRRKIDLHSEPTIPIYQPRISKKIPSISDEPGSLHAHPFEERVHENSFKVVINPHLKNGKGNPEILVEEIPETPFDLPENDETYPDSARPRTNIPDNNEESDDKYVKLKILDDFKPSLDNRPLAKSTKVPRKIDSDLPNEGVINKPNIPQESSKKPSKSAAPSTKNEPLINTAKEKANNPTEDGNGSYNPGTINGDSTSADKPSTPEKYEIPERVPKPSPTESTNVNQPPSNIVPQNTNSSPKIPKESEKPSTDKTSEKKPSTPTKDLKTNKPQQIDALPEPDKLLPVPEGPLSKEEKLLLDFLMKKLNNGNKKTPKESPDNSQSENLPESETPEVQPNIEMRTEPKRPVRKEIIRDPNIPLEEAIFDMLKPESSMFPPPHPTCFTEGLVEDELRCEVFHECILEDNKWEMYSWMCKPGTIFDPYRLACLAGTCS